MKMICSILFFVLLSPGAQAIRYGQKVAAAEFPEVFYISKGASFCTGVLIHPRVMLTVAHCLDEKSRATVYARSLKSGFFKNPQIQRIQKVIVKQHRPLHSELSLVFFKAAVEGIAPAEIDLDHRWQAGDEALIAGFGHNDHFQQSRGVLREGFISFSHTISHEGGKMWKFLPGSQDMQACQGDSGGPLFVETAEGRKLTGIVSFIAHDERSLIPLDQKDRCLEANSSFYIPIQLHQAWINSVLEKQL